MGGFLNDLLSRLISPASSLVQRIPYTPPPDPNRLQEFGGQAANLWNAGVDVSEFVRNAPGQVLGGLAGLPGQATDYLTKPRSQRGGGGGSAGLSTGVDPHGEFMRSMRPLDGPIPAAPVNSLETALMPDVLGLSTPTAAASTSAPMRAIRMPDGKFLFTNRPEYGGEEFSTAQAGAMVRAAGQPPATPAASPTPAAGGGFFGGKTYNWPSPTEATMRGLVAASARAAAGEPPPAQTLAARGKMTDGFRLPPGPGGFAPSADNPTGAAISRVEGTPQQQLALQLEQAAGVAALAQLAQREKIAKLSPMEAAALDSPQAVAMLVGMQMMGPQIQQKQQVTQARIAALGTPGTPDYIADEKQRAIVADEISRTSQQEIAYMLSLAGLRPPSGI